MKIAVIGSGIAGNIAAWALHPQHEVVVYEKRDRVGGHSATVDVDYDGKMIAVDTGFIVFNERNYPNLCALFQHLDIASEYIDMSFSVSCDDGAFEWSGDRLASIFAQKRNIVNPRFLKMLAEILRFNSRSKRDLDQGMPSDLSLGAYLETRRFAPCFVDGYLAPLGAAIWSTPHADILHFPAESFLRFLDNHRLLSVRPPDWRTVTGGSRSYVQKLVEPLTREPSAIRLASEVVQVRRSRDFVEVTDVSGSVDRFDQIVIAAHSDQALRLLGDEATTVERHLLGSIGYRDNSVYLHRDPSLMPKRKSVWSAWNYLGSRNPARTAGSVSVTYWMNTLQNIDKSRPLFVSLNPGRPPREDLTFGHYVYGHPQYDAAAVSAQKNLDWIQGRNRTWYCGAWCGYGFHEDGLNAGLAVAEQLGGSVPWRQPPRSVEQPMLLEAAE